MTVTAQSIFHESDIVMGSDCHLGCLNGNNSIEDNQVRLVREGTLLMSFKLTIGKLAFAGKDLFTNEAIAALTIKDEYTEKLLPEFLYWALHTVPLETDATLAVKGKTLNKKTMQVIPIPLPTIAEQQRLVARIEALLAEVREMRALQKGIDKNCNRLMDAFLGEIFAPLEMAAWPNRESMEEIAEITARQVDPTLPEYRNMPHIYGATIEEGTGRLLSFSSAAEDGMVGPKVKTTKRSN